MWTNFPWKWLIDMCVNVLKNMNDNAEKARSFQYISI